MALDMNAAVKITASVNGQSAVDQLRNSMDKMSSSAAGLAKTFAAGFLGVQAVQAVVMFGKSVLDTADQMDEMSQRTGLTVEQLSELDYAAKLSGTSLDAVQLAMGKLATKATEAATGNKTAAVAFEALGIKVKDANGNLKSQLQLFEEVGARISDIRDPTLRAAMAIEVFGKSGAKLLPMLQDMGALRKEARDLGGVVGADFAKNAAQFNDNLDRMSLLAKGLAKSILSDLIPAVNRLMESMIAASKNGGFLDMLGAGLKQTINNAAVDYKNVDQSIADLTKRLAAMKQTRAELLEDTLGNKINNSWLFGGDLKTIEFQIKNTTEVLKELQDIKKKAAETGPTGTGGADAAAKKALDALAKANKATAGLTDAQREAKRMEQERAQILQQLSDSVLKLADGEEALILAKLERLKASPKEISQAKDLLFEQDNILRRKEDEKNLEKLLEKQRRDAFAQAEKDFAALEAAAEEFANKTQKVWDETRTPLEKYNEKLKELEELKRQGGLTDDTATRAMNKAREDLMRETGFTFEDASTKMSSYSRKMRELEQLNREGIISFEQMQIAIGEMDREFKSMGKNSVDMYDQMKTAFLGFARDSADAIVDFVAGVEGDFSKMVESILRDLARMAVYKTITEPLFGWMGSFLPGAAVKPSANGNVFSGGSLQAFARGGIVNAPTLFPMANGTGLMGEAGPEAIMPLQRTPSGKLGVIAQGGGSTNNVTVNVNVESGQSTSMSDTSQAEKLGGYISKAVQAEILKQKRPGGVLFAGA